MLDNDLPDRQRVDANGNGEGVGNGKGGDHDAPLSGSAPGSVAGQPSAHSAYRSLADDIENIFDDGKTYIEAEIAFQKSRLSFAANCGKTGIILIFAALGLLHLALIGLVVGGIFALAPILGDFGALAAVVGGLLLCTVLCLLLALGKFKNLAAAFKDKSKDESEDQ